MKVSILQDQLAKGLAIVGKAVDTRSNLPVLANILLETEDSRLKLAATNLELTITTYIGAKVDNSGAVTLPSKTFQELINNLSPERVDLSLEASTQTIHIQCGVSTANIRGIAATEFPPIREDATPDVMIPAGILKEMITHTVFAAAREDHRPILTGLYVQFDGTVMTMAAADGFRLAVRTTRIEEEFSRPVDMVIPARTLSEVARVIVDEDREVGIGLPGDRDFVTFYIENTVITSQLLEGNFPDFSAIIPKTYKTVVTMYTDDFLSNCKRAEIFARDNNHSARIIARPAKGPSEPGELKIIGRSNERGDNENILDASVDGDALETSFNIRYLIDVLNIIPTERVQLESAGPMSAGVIRAEGRDDFLQLIMPMNPLS